ncbi:LPS export ABC transporter periplasmic protein LptC [Elioraea sp.]|uniref:LPS export ABC transporter periplasmic protein LptC n=1 Tax=Elioraea sp. TaxID=2185103 RepID=UPI003F71DDEA
MSVAATSDPGPARTAPRPAPRGRARTLGLGGNRTPLDPAALARRRVVVRVLKRALPAAALAALAMIVLWPEFSGMEERVRLAYRKPDSGIADSARLVAPRYVGRDERGRPYELAADTAEQPSGSETVALARPVGDITLEDGAWIMLRAATGWYQREQRLLDLAGEVALFHDAGYEIRTARARIDLAAGRAEGDDPVAAQGPPGTLDGTGFRLEDQGAVVIFTGPARMVLVPAEGSR